MAVDHIRYDVLTQEALRGMLRRILGDAAKHGLPGEHHFFVTFDTNAPSVKISPRLHAQHREQMTIVLQHQFWDLAVHDDYFEVGLAFGGIPEKLVVPFAAIIGFVDPSVEFGLSFEAVLEDDDADTPLVAATPVPQERPGPRAVPTAVPSSPLLSTPPAAAASGKTSSLKTASLKTDEGKTDPNGPDTDPPSGGGDVVRLDRFRKK
jgi:hypothetical protein